jgi:hypothetical protein
MVRSSYLLIIRCNGQVVTPAIWRLRSWIYYYWNVTFQTIMRGVYVAIKRVYTRTKRWLKFVITQNQNRIVDSSYRKALLYCSFSF